MTARLFNLVSDHTFPSAPTTKYVVTSFASSLMKGGGGGGGSAERNTTKEVLNCLRVLQRVLPVIFELESESSVFEREVLWKRDVVVVVDGSGGGGEDSGAGGQNHRERMEQTTQFVIEDDDEDEDDAESGRASAPASAACPSPQIQIPPKQTTTTLPSVAERLFGCLVDLLFCCGFTIPAKLQVDHYKISYVIW
jgi:hypothetical protein